MTNAIEHRRTHNLLLINKLLNHRESASPFSLVLDSVEQSARPLIRECIHRAKKAHTKIIFISLNTLRKPRGVDLHIPLWQHGVESLQQKINPILQELSSSQRALVIIDSLNGLCSAASTSNLPALLSSFLRPNVSLLAVYHTDLPIQSSSSTFSPYQPTPLSMLKYLATTILTVHSFHHLLEQKRARDRGHGEPFFGLEAGMDGILVGDGAQGQDGLVIEMEFRRKSGRGVKELFFLARDPKILSKASGKALTGKAIGSDGLILLEDHALWKTNVGDGDGVGAEDDPTEGVTFSLGLTDRQKEDREGVVLPYFDAQKGGGEGGRILYDMGVEDDFDEEEDEI